MWEDIRTYFRMNEEFGLPDLAVETLL